MEKWLAKLAEKTPKSEPTKLTKLTEAPFVGFGSSIPYVSEKISTDRLDPFRRLENLPSQPCPRCGYGRYWLADDGWRCIRCCPPDPVKPADLAEAVADWVTRDTLVVAGRHDHEFQGPDLWDTHGTLQDNIPPLWATSSHKAGILSV